MRLSVSIIYRIILNLARTQTRMLSYLISLLTSSHFHSCFCISTGEGDLVDREGKKMTPQECSYWPHPSISTREKGLFSHQHRWLSLQGKPVASALTCISAHSEPCVADKNHPLRPSGILTSLDRSIRFLIFDRYSPKIFLEALAHCWLTVNLEVKQKCYVFPENSGTGDCENLRSGLQRTMSISTHHMRMLQFFWKFMLSSKS